MNDAIAALRDLYDWCHNNVPYFPDISATDQNSGEADQPPEDLSQAIAKRVEAALKAHG